MQRLQCSHRGCVKPVFSRSRGLCLTHAALKLSANVVVPVLSRLASQRPVDGLEAPRVVADIALRTVRTVAPIVQPVDDPDDDDSGPPPTPQNVRLHLRTQDVAAFRRTTRARISQMDGQAATWRAEWGDGDEDYQQQVALWRCGEMVGSALEQVAA